MAVDQNEKMKHILDFYEQAQEIIEMVQENIQNFANRYGYDLISDQVIGECKTYVRDINEKAESRKKQLLIDLGRAGEYLIKYILLLEQMNLAPHQTIDEFMNNTLYTLGDKNPGQKNSTSGYYLNSSLITQNVFDDIKLEKGSHTLQPLHDYSYLFFILKRMFPDVVNDIYEVMECSIRSKMALGADLPDFVKKDIYVFPQLNFMEFHGISEADKTKYQSEFNRIINDSGDIFVRLRYIENNPNNKSYSLGDILLLMNCLFDYVRLVHHFNNDDISKNITIGYNQEKCIERRLEILGDVSNEDKNNEVDRIKGIFKIDRVANSVDLISSCVFYTKLSVEEIEEVSSINTLSDQEVKILIHNNINYDTYNRFLIRGITNVSDMVKIMSCDNDIDVFSLSDEDLNLIKWLDINTLNRIKSNTTVYNFIAKNPDVLKRFFGSTRFDDKFLGLFIELTSMEEIKNNPALINCFDCNQLRISDRLGSEFSDDEIMINVRRNLEFFKDTPELYAAVPLMLDCDNTKKILDLLSTQGLDMTKLDKLDTTVFCLPFSLVSEVASVLNDRGYSVVGEDNNLKVFFGVIELKRKYDYKGENREAPLPLRHRENYVTEVNNSVISELKTNKKD